MNQEQMRATLARRIEAANRKRDEAADMVQSSIERAKRFPTGATWSTVANYAAMAAQAIGEAEGYQFALELLGDED